MSNLEFLRYLEKYGILSLDPEPKENAEYANVWDSDGWNNLLIWFDKEGNVIDK